METTLTIQKWIHEKLKAEWNPNKLFIFQSYRLFWKV